MTTVKAVYFDMDGTIANLYAVEDWLPKLRANDPTPYKNAKVMCNMALLARYLKMLQKEGIKIGIISWLSKEPNAEYDKAVTMAKLKWLKTHLPSVTFDTVQIVAHGTPKARTVEEAHLSILFDDEQKNRDEWTGFAFEPEQIFPMLKILVSAARD